MPAVPQEIESQLPALARLAQKQYDAWHQDETGFDEEVGYGGICHLIADKMVGHLTNCGVPCTTVSAHDEVHVYIVAQLPSGVWYIDIRPHVYETGGGYTWTKIPDVEFTPNDIVVDRLSTNPRDMRQYVEDWEDEEDDEEAEEEEERLPARRPSADTSRGTRGETPWLPLGDILPAVPLMVRLKVSEVARSPRGFLTAYKRARGEPDELGTDAHSGQDWRARRNAFVARHAAQMKNEPLWDAQGQPTRRHLALIAWAMTPDPAGWDRWLAKHAPAVEEDDEGEEYLVSHEGPHFPHFNRFYRTPFATLPFAQPTEGRDQSVCVFLAPSDFLAMTSTLPTGSILSEPHVREYARAMRNGDRFPIPTLTLREDKKKGWIAVDHEGRHRAAAAMQAHLPALPIRLLLQSASGRPYRTGTGLFSLPLVTQVSGAGEPVQVYSQDLGVRTAVERKRLGITASRAIALTPLPFPPGEAQPADGDT